MVKSKFVYLKCSRCGKRFRGATRTEALEKLRKHLWKEHRDWMIARIKAGIRKAKKKAGNPRIIGFLEAPLIEKITGRPYEEVKAQVLDAFVRLLLSGISRP